MQAPTPSLPSKFLEKLDQLIPSDRLSEILGTFSKQLPSTFRTNTLKVTSEELQNQLESFGFELEQVAWYPDAFILRNQSQRALTETDQYKKGLLYIQSLSSMIPALVLNPLPGEKVLDMAAAPGSKTTQIATLMKNTGEIIANDMSKNRIYLLARMLQEQGVTTAKTTISPGEILWKKYPNYFDKVLVDAPCSMEGRFNTNDPKSYQDWTPKKVKILAQKQKYLLRAAITATKPGGTIVYSTCTLSPEENEEVIDWVLKKDPGMAIVEPINFPQLDLKPGLMKWNEKEFAAQVKNTARIWPSELMEGFFIAKLRRT